MIRFTTKQMATATAVIIAASLGASMAYADEVVYEDNFDNDGLATNAGTGGGLAQRTINTSTFGDNGNLVDLTGANNSQRGVVSSINSFLLTDGFTLEVHMVGGTGAIAQSFGLSTSQFSSDTNAECWMREQSWAGEGANGRYGIGVQTGSSNPGAGEPTPRGLKFNNNAKNSTAITNLATTAAGLLPAGTNTFVITVTPDDQFSYTYNGGTPVTGEIVAGEGSFDLSQPLFFNLYSQTDVAISYVKITRLVPAPANFGLVITPALSPATGYDLTWESQPGKLYNLRTHTRLEIPIATWSLIEGNIVATPPNNTYNVPADGPRRFYAVEEFDAPPTPPVYFEDFEADNGGFAVVGTPNDWGWGTPISNNGAGLVLTTGNGGSTKCWGTNLGTGGSPSGLINPDSDSILRSPEIDLTGVTGAQLNFATAYDAQVGDVIEVRVYNAVTDGLLGTLNPVTVPLPAASTWTENLGPLDLSVADNTKIYLEFRYKGTDPAYIGFYIDDVTITGNL